MADEIRAAGGIPWREQDGQLEVLLVHRYRYMDWTFPKGKVKEGETDEQAAVREVEEETGLRGQLGAELVSTVRVDSKERTKTVRYWAMRPVAGEGRPENEIDEVAWLRRDEAAARLTHDRDRDVLESLQP